jgi:hypothetical protein
VAKIFSFLTHQLRRPRIEGFIGEWEIRSTFADGLHFTEASRDAGWLSSKGSQQMQRDGDSIFAIVDGPMLR